MNTLIVQKMQHYYAFASGYLSKEMMKVVAWLGVKPFKEVKCEDSLQRDFLLERILFYLLKKNF